VRHPVYSLFHRDGDLTVVGGRITRFLVVSSPIKLFTLKRERGIRVNLRILGRAITQAVSRWLPTAAAWVRAQVRSCGIFGGQSGTGACLLRVLRFPLPIRIPPIAPQSSSII
jgi:hypothetical protein